MTPIHITKASLKKIQKQHNFTQVEYARKLGIGKQVLQNIYSGKTKKISSEVTKKATELEVAWLADQNSFEVSPNEKKLLTHFRDLSDSDKNATWVLICQKLLAERPF